MRGGSVWDEAQSEDVRACAIVYTCANEPFVWGIEMRLVSWSLSFVLAAGSFIACDENPVVDPGPPEGPIDPNPPSERVDVPEVTEIPDTCNGRKELCARPYNEVVFPGTHNSMSASDERWRGANQKYGLVQQLEDGIRLMMLDIHAWKGGLSLCHSFCNLGERPLDDALLDLRDFLRSQRGEVLTLILQDETDAERIIEAFKTAGLDKWAYAHPGGAWPTLEELIAQNKRLVVTAERSGGDAATPWYMYAWATMFDNSYTYKAISDFEQCGTNRGNDTLPVFLLNHWLGTGAGLPSVALSEQANTAENLMAHVEACQAEQGRLPTFLAVDHYHLGDLFEVVDTLNGF